jgi:uncharacterized protein (DUF342 family)
VNVSKDDINNGFFEVQYLEDGVYVTVYPPIGKSRFVEAKDIISRLDKKQVKHYNSSVIESIVKSPNKIPVKVAEPQEEVKLDANVNVMIAPDKMKAFISITPPDGGKMATIEEIINKLKENGVVFGINRTVLEDLVKFPVYNEMICVAEGTEPIKGENGKIEFNFDIKKNMKPAILEDGRVDFRSLDLIESVSKGQVLCTLVPPMPGTKGRTVVGTDILAQDGKPAVLPRGRNVEISEDGQALLSCIEGQVTYVDGKVNVFSTYEVPADVDNSTGNIKFVGNVRINGNVLSGFSVEAGGSIEVWGVVEAAVLKAGGDIILRRGMQGMGKGLLSSEGDIVAKYIEHSNAVAKNNIKAEAIMHSNIKCGNKLELSGRKGLLVGGTCKVGKEVEAKVIGSYIAATLTDIEVGVDPSLRERHRELKNELTQAEDSIKKANQAITLLKRLEAAGALTPEKQQILAKSIRTKLFFTSRISELKEEITGVEMRLQQDANGKVKSLNYIYPGTKVAIGTCVMYVKETLQHCTLYRDGADIRVGPLV